MEHSEVIKNIYQRSLEMYSSGDPGITARFVSRHPGALILGTDPAEWIESTAQILAVIPTYAPLLGQAGIILRPGECRAYSRATSRSACVWPPAWGRGHLARPRLSAVSVSPILRVSRWFRFTLKRASAGGPRRRHSTRERLVTSARP